MGDTTKKEVESIQMKTIFNGKEIVKQTLEGDFRPLPKPKPQQEMEEEKYVQGLEFIIKRLDIGRDHDSASGALSCRYRILSCRYRN